MTQREEAIEFVKQVRKFVKMYENEVPRRAEITFLEEACDIIDEWEKRYEDITGGMMKKEIYLIQENVKLQSRLDTETQRADKAEEKLGAEGYRFREQKQISKELEAKLKDLEAKPRCPCGGNLEGTGYDKTTKDVVFDCNKCEAQLTIKYELWQQILKQS